MKRLLRDQWTALRAWLDEADVRAHADLPSGLGTWSVGDLVAHLGLSLGMLTEITPAPADAEPMSVRRYVGAYPPAAQTISSMTHDLAASLAPDVLAGLDDIAARSWTALDALDAPVVLGRRGPLRLDDYLATRLLELVVHGDDLHRALPDPPPSPVLDAAAERVAAVLRTAYAEATGRDPDVTDALAWVRLAAGRVPIDDPHLPLL